MRECVLKYIVHDYTPVSEHAVFLFVILFYHLLIVYNIYIYAACPVHVYTRALKN